MDSTGPLRQCGAKRRAKTYAGSRRHAGEGFPAQAQVRPERRDYLGWHPAGYSRSHQLGGPFKFAGNKMTRAGSLIDSHGRVLRDLRVSITDRCNFRCLYCLPETEAAHNFYRGRWASLPNSTPIVLQWVPKSHILSFEEIERVVQVAIGLGIEKIRLTGGEPLLRNGVEGLVGRIAAIPGVADLAMTTNGFLFAQKAIALR